MSFSMYSASIPIFARFMRNLSACLEKAQADSAARKYDTSVLVGARLAPDMHSLARQIQIASDTVKNGAARLAGIEAPSFPDTETSFEELQARIAKTVAFVESVTPAQMEGSDTRPVTLKFPGRELHFVGADYLNLFVLPNMYFHVATAYAILRHNGVSLGKMDFIGGV